MLSADHTDRSRKAGFKPRALTPQLVLCLSSHVAHDHTTGGDSKTYVVRVRLLLYISLRMRTSSLVAT